MRSQKSHTEELYSEMQSKKTSDIIICDLKLQVEYIYRGFSRSERQ